MSVDEIVTAGTTINEQLSIINNIRKKNTHKFFIYMKYAFLFTNAHSLNVEGMLRSEHTNQTFLNRDLAANKFRGHSIKLPDEAGYSRVQPG